MTMDRWLVISATFVHGRYHGGRGQGERDSWPPSPLRLFQALVAGARTGYCANSWTKAKASAFSWLEALDPPEIVAPIAAPGTDFTLFVPDNDMDKPAAAWAEGREPHDNFKPERLRSGKVHRPWIVGDDASVHYLWGIPAAVWPEMQAPAEIIAAEARRLIALGRTIDVVVGDGRILTREAPRRSRGSATYRARRRERRWSCPPPPKGRSPISTRVTSALWGASRGGAQLGSMSAGSCALLGPFLIAWPEHRRRGTTRPFAWPPWTASAGSPFRRARRSSSPPGCARRPPSASRQRGSITCPSSAASSATAPPKPTPPTGSPSCRCPRSVMAMWTDRSDES
jgi:hypothetical protein